MIDFALEGRVAIVTGATRGLGRAIVDAFAAEGVRTLATGRSQEDLDGLVDAHGELVATARCDMHDRVAVAALPGQALERFGRLDIVVNNAGIGNYGRFLDQEQSTWDDTMEVNLAGSAVLLRSAGRHLTAAGSGKVINNASIGAAGGKPGLSGYSASKAAMVALTRTLAVEWARFGVQVNAVAPGAFATDVQAEILADPALLERRLATIPARRMGEPAELAPLVCYLASPLSDFVTGAVFSIDGGEAARM